MIAESLYVRVGAAMLEGELEMPDGARAVAVFAHGSGTDRFGRLRGTGADPLTERSIGTLFIDLLTADEACIDDRTRHLRFDIRLLTERLGLVVEWCRTNLGPIGVCLVASGTGAAAALECAALRPKEVAAVVCIGGRNDLARRDVLKKIVCPVLLIAGGESGTVTAANRMAAAEIGGLCDVVEIPGATAPIGEPRNRLEAEWVAARWLREKLAAVSG